MGENFIELGRTFHVSPATAAERDDIELTHVFGRSAQLTWSDLRERARVVILSGAGAGKTEEVREQARQLHQQGKPAFFLRIEHVVSDFAGAFDAAAGNHEQFLAWIASGEEGWIFLDSVDEARLKSAYEFDQAIKRMGRELKTNLQQAHILITGREAAWRAVTDGQLVRDYLPYIAPQSHQPSGGDEDDAEPAGQDSELEATLDEMLEDEQDDTSIQSPKELDPNQLLVVGFDDLRGSQIEAFARVHGVSDMPQFTTAIELKEAQADTARPGDLEGLVDYWKAHGQIGSQSELTDAGITRRLIERNPIRAQATTLTREQLREGARRLAAAATFTQTADIRLPAAPKGVDGLLGGDILEWSESDINTLLQRPLFAHSVHGSMRFHVQKTREFLTAEYLHQRLVDHGSRARIESLFFRMQYGREVVVPSMRGVLPWLALRDRGVLDRVRRVAPEVMFEGGDPRKLPLDVRRQLLVDACKQLANPTRRTSVRDYQAVQRFAAPDLADDIRALLSSYRDVDEVVYFLMRMVWQGEIREVVSDALQVALTQADSTTRIVAMRAVAALGSHLDQERVRANLLSQSDPVDRAGVAEVLATLPRDATGMAWLLEAIPRIRPEKRFSVDPLPRAVEAFVSELGMSDLPALIHGLQRLMVPDIGEDPEENIGKRKPFDWLLGAAIDALNRLVQARDPSVREAPTMALLRRLPVAVRYGDNDDRADSTTLGDHVAAWPELNRDLFWRDVQQTRLRRFNKSGETLQGIWGVGFWGHYWTLVADDFDYIEGEIAQQPEVDDRFVALAVAMVLYRGAGKPRAWRNRLHRRVKGVAELEAALHLAFNPPKDAAAEWKQQERRWKRRHARDEAKRKANDAHWVESLKANVGKLRQVMPGGGIRNGQYHLYLRLRELDRDSEHWTEGRWRSLVPEFGLDVAEAFRDGAIAYWRTYRPTLASDGAPTHTGTIGSGFGLIGLMFEARHVPDWTVGLSAPEAELAMRYAIRELNGFPKWLPAVYARHPESVLRVLLGEIDHELRTATDEDGIHHYVLGDVSYFGGWLADRMGTEILVRLATPPTNGVLLRQMLAIVAASPVEDDAIAALARKHSASELDEVAAVWFAAWIGVEPEPALTALAAHLTALPTRERQIDLAMQALTALTGDQHERRLAREAYGAAPHLSALYLLVTQYLVEAEDLERAGKGAYSPTLRDNAQKARDGLLQSLMNLPGHATYLALQRICALHPTERGKETAARLAHGRAVADADRAKWSPAQVRDFFETLERTPANHQELHDLAVDRLLDYKHFLEEGETSTAELLIDKQETIVRNAFADWCKREAGGRYQISQEEERADRKRTDVRFHGVGFANPIPIELKLANEWAGTVLVERLENQLCNDYLRDKGSSRGVYLLMYQGGQQSWVMPNGSKATSFEALVTALQVHWDRVARQFPHAEDIRVIGIDLTRRAQPKGRSPAKKTSKKKVAAKAKSPAKK